MLAARNEGEMNLLRRRQRLSSFVLRNAVQMISDLRTPPTPACSVALAPAARDAAFLRDFAGAREPAYLILATTQRLAVEDEVGRSRHDCRGRVAVMPSVAPFR
jgi:hypothetical protein